MKEVNIFVPKNFETESTYTGRVQVKSRKSGCIDIHGLDYDKNFHKGLRPNFLLLQPLKGNFVREEKV